MGNKRWNRLERGRKGERLLLPFFTLFTFLPLFVVIGLSFYNGACAIERLGEDEPHHLVGERHLGEGDFLVGAVVNRLRETVGAANHEHESSGSGLLALYPLGKLYAAELLSVFIHQHHGIRRLNLLQNQFTLPFLLLLFAKALGILELRDGGDAEGHVVGDALGIILDARHEMLVHGLSDQYQFCLHFLNRILLNYRINFNLNYRINFK